MSKLFVIMGKSATGKDSIFKALIETIRVDLTRIIPYTTRPIREGETDGIEYYFISEESMDTLISQGKVIERRTYQTMYGDWNYLTVDDGQFNLEEKKAYLMIATPEAYRKLVQYFGKENVIPLLIEVEDGVRLSRALQRERQQKNPKYAEMCRRYLADEMDFSDKIIKELNVKKIYKNEDFQSCIHDIVDDIIKTM